MGQFFLDREGIAIILVGIVVVVLLGVAAFVLINVSGEPGDSGVEGADVPDQTVIRPLVLDSTLEFRYEGEEGRTVLELLERDHTVRLDSELLLFGSIVLAIDSFAAAPNEYWIYYRDSARGDRSPEVCTTYAGETIRWVLRRRR